MASALKNLTRVGADVRQIARLLQAKAPPGHKLAYISEEEAQLLKDRGGSGRITESGIPSYEEIPSVGGENTLGFDQPVQTQASYGGDITSAPVSGDVGGGIRAAAAPVGGGYDFGAYSPTSADTLTPQLTRGGLQGITPDIIAPSLAAPGGVSPYDVTTGRAASELAAPEPDVTKPKTGMSDATLARLGISGLQALVGGSQIRAAQQQAQQAAKQTQALAAPGGVSPYDVTTGRAASELAAPEPDVTKPKTGMSDATLARLGISGLQALVGGSQIRAAQQQAQQAAKQTQALAAPYQAQGQQLLAQAQRGELTPANQQIIQAERARAAQGVQQRGGVGVMQAEAQIQAMTNNLLQNQMNFGLQLQTIGDKIAQGAIQAGVQADQYVNSLTSNYAMNIARTLAGGLPGGTTATATPQA